MNGWKLGLERFREVTIMHDAGIGLGHRKEVLNSTLSQHSLWITWQPVWEWLLGTNLDLDNIELEMDAKVVVGAFNSDAQGDSTFGCYIRSCRDLFSTFNCILLRFVPRIANVVTHSFARALVSFLSPHSWVEPPSFVDDLLDSFCNSCE
ncbi:hypothetical protein ACS0TY_016849 [Phlomoides rotata]